MAVAAAVWMALTASGQTTLPQMTAQTDGTIAFQATDLRLAPLAGGRGVSLSATIAAVANLTARLATVEAIQSALSQAVATAAVPSCPAQAAPGGARFGVACPNASTCIASCSTGYSGTATTLSCTAAGWVGVYPRCVASYTAPAGTTNLATVRTGSSRCGDGVAFRVAHITGSRQLVLAAPAAGFTPGCLFGGDDLLMVAPQTGHYAVVTVLAVTSDGFGVTLARSIPPVALAGSGFFVTRIAAYDTLTVPAGAVLSTSPFDPAVGYGGVVAIRANTLNLAGTINASAAGFAGGSPTTPPGGPVGPTAGGGGGGGASGHGCTSEDNTTTIIGPQSAPGHGADRSRDGVIVQQHGGNGGSALGGGGGGGAGYGWAGGSGGIAAAAGGNGGTKTNNLGSSGSVATAPSGGGGGGSAGRDSAGGGGGGRPYYFDPQALPPQSPSRLLFGVGAAAGGGGGGGGSAGDFQCAQGGSGGFMSGVGGVAGTGRCVESANVPSDGAAGQPGGAGGGAVVLIAPAMSVSGAVTATGGPGGDGGSGGRGGAQDSVCMAGAAAQRRRPSEGGGGGGGGG
eukprot:CAMPEP_0182932836 /NCGR_PEP_ID=MMETSP0105_2-20130417/32377_1 /TAXON_ID=81532 ORGANISM="Acanthoeca-like sp., Strain 10tr" /NCGR_SAMPLE_ID=MMETSP0105_2 /ASSEMBLY_ACC=CAM_ASM_000205 /LENGTH=568 /DNA_ID=CAMNT_0025071491 /DNA_START=51 /DNA_END=1754 /DNA_ORIENTATION=-